MICPNCNNFKIKFLHKFNDGPVMNHNFFDSATRARKEKTAVIALWGCLSCGLVFNRDFNIKITNYSSSYDNAQINSPYFKSYMKKLADRLVYSLGLKDKKVVEIGCGKGDFLEMLYLAGVKDLVGFDPTYVNHNVSIDRLVKKVFFNKVNIKGKIDCIICRHTLEHIPNPRKFVRSVVECLAPGGVMYFEVPDLKWIVKHKTFFDFTYEHCNYFTYESIRFLFGQFGFGKVKFQKGLSGQYIQAEIRSGSKLPRQKSFSYIKEIPSFIKKTILEYKKLLKRLGRFAIWGAGGKGVIFVNRLKISAKATPYIIDINPRKQNLYIPRMGQKVVSPEVLLKERFDAIIIMNPIYEKEIKKLAAKQCYKGKFILV